MRVVGSIRCFKASMKSEREAERLLFSCPGVVGRKSEQAQIIIKLCRKQKKRLRIPLKALRSL